MPKPRPSHLLRAVCAGLPTGLCLWATLSHPSDVAGLALFSFVEVRP
jgi:hypothetical protein